MGIWREFFYYFFGGVCIFEIVVFIEINWYVIKNVVEFFKVDVKILIIII